MRKKVKHYQGKEITNEVIRKMNLIELKRQKEGLTTFTIENIDNLEELCNYHDTIPEQENIIIGEDWYLIYTTYKSELENQEWLAINNVKDKLIQTIEMLNSLKKVLLENKDKTIYSILRHSTSYKFYKLFLERNYLKEIESDFSIADEIPEDLLSIIENRNQHIPLEEYLDTEEKEVLEDLPDFIFHNVEFKVTNQFIKKYQKKLEVNHGSNKNKRKSIRF